jgi:hypothetical protein
MGKKTVLSKRPELREGKGRERGAKIKGTGLEF